MKNLFRQSKGIPWVGAVQVQVINSLIYLSVMNSCMLAFTVWHTAGYEITRQYAPWVNIWIFFTLLISGFLVVMYLDYKMLYPSRVEHNNRQAYKQKNPAVDDLQAILADLKRIKQELGIDEEE